MTNNHIVEGAESIEVTLFDGRKFKGKLVGTDPTSDIAVVKVEDGSLPSAKLGDTSDIKSDRQLSLSETHSASCCGGRQLPSASSAPCTGPSRRSKACSRT